MKRTSNLSVAENVNRKLKDLARQMGGGNVQIGFLANGPLSTYPDGTPVATVAFWNEFGHGGESPSPPRPFFRTMIAKESPSWPGKMEHLAKSTKFDGAAVLKLIGEDIAGALQESIANFTDPPNAPSTVKAKGFNKPLVDTGQMLRAVSYEVKKP